MLNGVTKCHRGRSQDAVRVLWESRMSGSSAERDLCSTILCQMAPRLVADITARCCRIRSGQFVAADNWNCCRMVSLHSRTIQHLITIMMCKVWCNVVAGRCWHILPALQILPHVIIGYLHLWQNFCWEKDLNQKNISTVLCLSLNTVWARMIIELWMTVYHVVGKVCGHCWCLHSVQDMCVNSYNKSQRDAVFHKFILVKNSTCFRQIYCPSSGVSTLYIQQ